MIVIVLSVIVLSYFPDSAPPGSGRQRHSVETGNTDGAVGLGGCLPRTPPTAAARVTDGRSRPPSSTGDPESRRGSTCGVLGIYRLESNIPRIFDKYHACIEFGIWNYTG